MRTFFLVTFAMVFLFAAVSAVAQWGDESLTLPWHILLTALFVLAATFAAAGFSIAWSDL